MHSTDKTFALVRPASGGTVIPDRYRAGPGRHRRVAVAVAAALALVAGCGTTAPEPTAVWQTPSGSAVPHGAGPSGPPPSGGGPRDITLEFAGDVHFIGRTAKLLDDPATAFGPITQLLSSADVTVLNLETVVTTRGTPQPKRFHFRAPAGAFTAVRDAGIDAVTIANNHILDYGRVGLADTLAAARAADYPAFGAGADAAAAWAPWTTTVAGTRIAYLGFSDVQELASSWIATPDRSGVAHANDLSRTLDAVRAARKLADVVVVFMHWGTEGDSCPNASQKSLAQKLADAGADIIIGSHVHTLQGSGWLGHTFVAYGMGNFLWYINSWSTQTGVLRLTLHPGARVPYKEEFTPAIVSGTGQPVVQTGKQGKAISDRYASLRACAGLSANPTP
ncbi:MAG TPA: CapA family protein [Micromonosporaceae bacterium]|nr:CapA family protein [Micromonosporaceae bacterium]